MVSTVLSQATSDVSTQFPCCISLLLCIGLPLLFWFKTKYRYILTKIKKILWVFSRILISYVTVSLSPASCYSRKTYWNFLNLLQRKIFQIVPDNCHFVLSFQTSFSYLIMMPKYIEMNFYFLMKFWTDLEIKKIIARIIS